MLRPLAMALGRLLRRDHDLTPRGDILVVKMQGGGSLVIAMPALLGLRRSHPTRRLRLLTTPGVAVFARALNVFDEILEVDDRGLLPLFRSALAVLPRVVGVDTVLDLEVYSRLTTVVSSLTLARNRIGFYLENAYWRRHLHTHLTFLNRFSGIYLFYDEMVALLGAKPASSEECRDWVARHLGIDLSRRSGSQRVAIGAGCSEFGTERQLTDAQWLLVFERQAAGTDAEYVFLGNARDGEQAERLTALLREKLPAARFANRCGELTLVESLRELATAREFWGVDSALLHCARLFGTPAISFWGPTDPNTRLRPQPNLQETAYYWKVRCSPCIHVAETPPCAGRNRCIDNLFGPLDDAADGDGTFGRNRRFSSGHDLSPW